MYNLYSKDKKRKSVYVEDLDLVVNTSVEHPYAVDYMARVEGIKQSPKQFFSMRPLGVDKEEIVRDSLIQQMTRGAGSAVGDLVMNVGNFGYRNLNSAINYGDKLVSQMKAENSEEWYKYENEYNQLQRELREEVLRYKDNWRKRSQAWGLSKEDGDGFFYDLGNGIGSLASAVGLAVSTGGAGTAGLLFGVSSGESTYEEALEKGFTPERAALMGTTVGTVEGALEAVGLKSLSAMARSSKFVKRLVGGAASEFLQEFLQEGASGAQKKLYGLNNDEWNTVFGNAVYAGFIGGILGGGASVAFGATHKKLTEAGMPEDVARKQAFKVAQKLHSQEGRDEIRDMLQANDSEIVQKLEGRDDKAIGDIIKGIRKRENEFFDIRKQSREYALKSGLNSQEADHYAFIEQARAVNLYNNGGIVPADFLRKHRALLEIEKSKITAKQKIHDGQDRIDPNDPLALLIKIAQESDTAEQALKAYQEMEVDKLKTAEAFSRLYMKEGKSAIKAFKEFFDDIKQRPQYREDGEVYFQDDYETTDSPDILKTKRGYVRFDGNQAVIRILENGNESTLFHEMGHIFLNDLKFVGGETYNKTLEWLGSEDGIITRDMHEKFADTFVLYLKSGESPAPYLTSVFKSFKQWLRDVYNTAIGKGVKPDAKIKEIFDTLIAPEKVESFDYDIKRARDMIKKIKSGETAKLSGRNVREIRGLLSDLRKRLPAKPETLLTAIRRAGGIDKRSSRGLDIARALDDKAKTIMRDGGIQGDELGRWMVGQGFINESMEGYYSESRAQEKAMDLLERAAQEDVVRAEDQGDLDLRKSLIENKEDIERVLQEVGDVDEFIEQIDKLEERGLAVVDVNELDVLDKQISQIKKIRDQRSLRASTKSSIKTIQSKIENQIRDLEISNENKFKLIGKIKNANSPYLLNKIQDEIAFRATELLEMEKKQILQENIKAILKSSMDVSINNKAQGRYDYETNKLFSEIRDLERMNQEKAGAVFQKMEKLAGENYDSMSEADGILMRFARYKMLGRSKGTAALFEQVQNDLLKLQEIGKIAKTKEEFDARLNDIELTKDLAEGVSKLGGDKVSRLTRGTLSFMGDWKTVTNYIFGKKLAEKLSIVSNEDKVANGVYKRTRALNKNIQTIYGLKNKNQVQFKLLENAKKQYKLEFIEGDDVYELSKNDLISIYNHLKNPKMNERYTQVFGGEQLNALMENLTTEDIMFADELRKMYADYYDEMNAVHIRLYNKDLPRIENYTPSSSEYQKDLDIFNDFELSSMTPSAFKQRAKGKIVPKPIDAYQAASRYINQAEWITKQGERIRELSKALKDPSVARKVRNKYSDDFYNNLIDKFNHYTLGGLNKKMNAVDGFYSWMLGNWTVSKIALNPSVFSKQLISSINFMSQMPSIEWAKGFSEGIINARKTAKYMMENSEMLKTRFDRGGSDTVARAINAVESYGSKVSLKLNKETGINTISIMQFMTSLQRMGDIGAIIYGGYPYVRHLQKMGMTKEQAFEKFVEVATETQQSNFTSQKSDFQNTANGVAKALVVFKNTPMQYFRKVFNSIVEYSRGEASSRQLAKDIAIFGIINPTLYGYMNYLFATGIIELFNDVYDDDEENEKVVSEIMHQVMSSPFNSIPLLGPLVDSFISAHLTKGYSFAPGTPVITDVYDAFTNFSGRPDLDLIDLSRVIGEITTGLPIGVVERYIKKFRN